MNVYQWLVVASWLVLAAYWAIAAIGAKRNVGAAAERGKRTALRWGLVVLIVLALRIPALRAALRIAEAHVAGGAVVRAAGVALCALGIALAVWARAHLGRNWGMPMSRKQNPDLVTTGPYARVRHPIYAGILLAMLGSGIADSIVWLLPLLLFGAYFVYSARREEALMIGLFPADYPAYMKRSRMLVPWPRRARSG